MRRVGQNTAVGKILQITLFAVVILLVCAAFLSKRSLLSSSPSSSSSSVAMKMPVPMTRVIALENWFLKKNSNGTTHFQSMLQYMGSSPPDSVNDYVTSLVTDWWRVHQSQIVTDTNTMVVAYCKFDQKANEFYPERQAEWLAWWMLGAHAFPNHRVLFPPCVAHPRLLPEGISRNSKMGMRLLGLVDVDIRICPWGSSEIIKVLVESGVAKKKSFNVAPMVRQYPGIELDSNGWTNHKRLYWPQSASLLVSSSENNNNSEVMTKPMLIRENIEPWAQFSEGVALQFEAKRESKNYARNMVGMYQPHLVNSVGRRLAPGREQRLISVWTLKAHGLEGPFPDSMEELVTRPIGFDPVTARRFKTDFAAYQNSHCRSSESFTTSVVIRDIFAFALAKYRPVNAIAACPYRGTSRLGMTHEERVKVTRRYTGMNSVDVYKRHKFALVFENSGVEGYLSEKLLNAYAGHAVPVYFGSDLETLKENINMDAIVHCDVPHNVAGEAAVRQFRSLLCSGLGFHSKTLECEMAFLQRIEENFVPHFSRCIERIIELDKNDGEYDKVLSQPLVPNGRLIGIWNSTLSGELLRVVYEVLGYSTSPPLRESMIPS